MWIGWWQEPEAADHIASTVETQRHEHWCSAVLDSDGAPQV